MDVVPGEYTAWARADGYADNRQDITIGEAGTDLRLALARGLTISGRVVDAGGRPAGGCPVSVHTPSDGGYGGFLVTLSDGSFQAKGLLSRVYTLFAGSSLAGFAVRVGVSAGTSDVTLALQPGGQARLRVRGPDGLPVSRAHAELRKVDGVPVGNEAKEGWNASDALGMLLLTLPAGADEIWVMAGKFQATVTVVVPGGGAVGADVVLKATPE